ncbi:MAG: endolytic transglycosylase MltG [Thermodesulfovibrionales bacterium]|nr:endolytic transglycosylase MltG [Thermodesulfovibrionales bacterium]
MMILKNTKLILLATVTIFIAYLIIQLFVPSYKGTVPIEIEIPEGATFRKAMEILQENNLIRDKNIFLLIGRITGVDKKIRAGFYRFWGNISPYEVYKHFKEGKIIEFEVVVKEGDSLNEIREKLKRFMSYSEFDKLSSDKNFLLSLNIHSPSLEGYLYPDTYKFPKGMKATSIFKIMVDRLRSEYNQEIIDKMQEYGWSENELLTLASIIEREAVVDKERAIISAVYHNRLRLKMPLQADPTAIYGIKSYKEKIYRKDYQNKTQYNTYLIKGLPPGPIASPSIASIKAALHPAKVSYLYFVSRNDGTHVFSKTLQEHNIAIRNIKKSAEKDEG